MTMTAEASTKRATPSAAFARRSFTSSMISRKGGLRRSTRGGRRQIAFEWRRNAEPSLTRGERAVPPVDGGRRMTGRPANVVPFDRGRDDGGRSSGRDRKERVHVVGLQTSHVGEVVLVVA